MDVTPPWPSLRKHPTVDPSQPPFEVGRRRAEVHSRPVDRDARPTSAMRRPDGGLREGAVHSSTSASTANTRCREGVCCKPRDTLGSAATVSCRDGIRFPCRMDVTQTSEVPPWPTPLSQIA